MDNNGRKAETEKQIQGNNSGAGALKGRLYGLFKKAKELTILCDCQVMVIIVESTGKIQHYCNVSIDEIISKFLRITEGNLMQILKEEVKSITSKQRPLSKEDDDYMQKLLEMTKQLLVFIEEKKDELLKQKLHRSRKEQYMDQSDSSSKQAMNLLNLFPTTTSSPSESYYVESDLMQTQNSSSSNGSCIFYNSEVEEGNSDTTLRLGLPYYLDRKRKEPEKETELQLL